MLMYDKKLFLIKFSGTFPHPPLYIANLVACFNWLYHCDTVNEVTLGKLNIYGPWLVHIKSSGDLWTYYHSKTTGAEAPFPTSRNLPASTRHSQTLLSKGKTLVTLILYSQWKIIIMKYGINFCINPIWNVTAEFFTVWQNIFCF